MTCPRCKTETLSSVCPRCATPLTASFIPSQPQRQSPATDLLKKHCRSPLALILAILVSLQFLGVFASSTVSSILELAEVQQNALLYSSSTAVASLPVIIGIWIAFAQAHDRRRPYMKDSGFAVIHVCTIIALVVMSIFAFIVFAAAVFIFIGLFSGNSAYLISYLAPVFRDLPADAAVAVIYAAVFFGAIFIAFILVFLAESVKSLSFVRAVARRSRGKDGISAIVPVGAFVFAIVYAVSAACYFVMGAWLSGGCEAFAAVCAAVAGIFFARLRRDIDRLPDPDEAPPQPVSAPARTSPEQTSPEQAPSVQVSPEASSSEPATPGQIPCDKQTDTPPAANPYVRIERR